MYRSRLILMLLCLAASSPPMPKVPLYSPKHAEQIKSLATTSAPTPPQKQVMLYWSFSGYTNNIVFDIYHNYGTNHMTLFATTPQTNYVFTPNLPVDFFGVKARDTLTGFVSDWNK